MISLLEKLSGYLLIPLAWTFITIALMCIPGSEFPGIGMFSFKNADKLIHFILYGSMAMLWSYFFLTRIDPSRWEARVMLICSLVIVLGIIMEYVQKHLIPFRDFDGMDIVANSVGAIVFSIIIVLLNRKRRGMKKPLWKQGL